MSKREFNKKVVVGKFVLILLLGIALGVSCLFSKPIEKFLGIGDKEGNFVSDGVIKQDDLTIHYIDVGQGDCTLICLPDDKVMMIDAAEASEADTIIEYVQNLGITTIDYFVVTHSDSDHSGGAYSILKTFNVNKIYRPFQIAKDKDTNTIVDDLGVYNTLYSDVSIVSTDTYCGFINAVYDEHDEIGAEVWVSYDGLTIESTNADVFTFTFYAPLVRSGDPSIETKTAKTKGFPTKYYSDNNDNSPVMLLEYKTHTFMFSGDATATVESDFVNSLEEEEKTKFEDVDVFKAAHHGSNTSNTEKLLDLITPNYIVVSSGNEYGHPHEEILERFDSYQHDASDYLLRTDTVGNIIFGYNQEGSLCYTAIQSGVGGKTIYWWYIAVGIFVCLTIVILMVKVTKNVGATAKRAVSTSSKVYKRMKKR